jgi:hypothetical protein
MPVIPPTGARGQALALSIALFAEALLWFGAVTPIHDWYLDRAELLRRQDTTLRRMTSLVATLPALRREAEADNGSPNTALLTGASDALAAASLQQKIEDLAGKSGVRVGSEEILPGTPDGTLRAVAVRLTVATSFRSLVDLLLALASSETPMIVDELQLRGPAPTTKDVDQTIDASLTIVSYRVPTGGGT